MNSLLMGGTLAAAFAAGMVAFFAPCCAGVMLPAYLAAVGGGHRFRVARLTAVYVAGVALVVLPITLGVAALASTISRWHPEMFTLGGLMMIGVAVMLWRGSMLPITVHQPRLSGSIFSLFALGVFSGAATACCAPVLAGAAALSAVSMSLGGGLLLGVAYVAGMMLPLIPVALIYGRAKQRLRDPRVTLRLGSYRKRIGVAQLGGMVIFAAFGALFIALALTGNSENAPGFQVVMGDWMRHVGHYVALVPNVISLPILVALIAAFVYAMVKRGSRPDQPQRNDTADAGGHAGSLESDHLAVTLGPEQRNLT